MSLQTAEDVEPIANALKAQSYSKLHIYGAAVDCDETPTVSAAAAPALKAALEAHGKSLKIIKLVGHRFESDAAMYEILDSLSSATGLEEIDLTNTSLGTQGGVALARLLEARASTVHTLKVEDCGLEEPGCLAVSKAISKLTKLKELDIRNNDMEADSAAALGAALAGKTEVTAIKVDEDEDLDLTPVEKALSALGKASALIIGDEEDVSEEEGDGGDDGEEEEEEGEVPTSPAVATTKPPLSGGFSFGSTTAAAPAPATTATPPKFPLRLLPPLRLHQLLRLLEVGLRLARRRLPHLPRPLLREAAASVLPLLLPRPQRPPQRPQEASALDSRQPSVRQSPLAAALAQRRRRVAEPLVHRHLVRRLPSRSFLRLVAVEAADLALPERAPPPLLPHSAAPMRGFSRRRMCPYRRRRMSSRLQRL